MKHDIGREGMDGGREGGSVEHIAHDRLYTFGGQRLGLIR